MTLACELPHPHQKQTRTYGLPLVRLDESSKLAEMQKLWTLMRRLRFSVVCVAVLWHQNDTPSVQHEDVGLKDLLRWWLKMRHHHPNLPQLIVRRRVCGHWLTGITNHLNFSCVHRQILLQRINNGWWCVTVWCNGSLCSRDHVPPHVRPNQWLFTRRRIDVGFMESNTVDGQLRRGFLACSTSSV